MLENWFPSSGPKAPSASPPGFCSTGTFFWSQRGDDIDGEVAGDQSGHSTSLSADGSILAVGAPGNDCINGTASGHVRVFKWNETNIRWDQLGQDIDSEAADDDSGRGVALSGDGTLLAVGAPCNDEFNDPIQDMYAVAHVPYALLRDTSVPKSRMSRKDSKMSTSTLHIV